MNQLKRLEKQLEPSQKGMNKERLHTQSEYYVKEIRRYLHDDVPAEEIDLVHFEDNTEVIDETMRKLTTDELRQIIGTKKGND